MNSRSFPAPIEIDIDPHLQSLNEWQKKAVTTSQGKVLVLAGAGSGKTTVLTKRIVYLLHQGVNPETILGLTFTNKAASEMSERLAKMVGVKVASKVHLSTFHSFALYLLRREAHAVGMKSNFTIADRQDILRHLQTIARDLLEHERGDLPSLQCLLDDIAESKNKCVPIEKVALKRSISWYPQFAREVFNRLNACLRIYNIVDFDHMLWLTNELLEKNKAILDKYSARFRYIMIDEYQDTNPVQAKIAEKIASSWGNLCVVGDDDQSIYSWRGADVANILNFNADTVIKLEQNFRSTPIILNAANSVIQANQERYSKSLWSKKELGKKIQVLVCPNEEAEAQAVVERMIAMRDKYALGWKDFCVLYRSNALSKTIETALLKARYRRGSSIVQSIPYRVYGGDELFEHKEVKDILSYLKVVANPADHGACLRSINYPRRGIGEATLEFLEEYAKKHSISFFEAARVCASRPLDSLDTMGHAIQEKAIRGIKQYVHIIHTIEEWIEKGAPLERVVLDLVQLIDLKAAVFSEIKSEAMRKWKEERLQSFFEAVRSFDVTLPDNPRMSELVESSSGKEKLHSLLSAFDLQHENRAFSKEKEFDDSVSLMTFHSAKGLEFPVCFLIGIEDHLIPHEKSLQERGLEEERRLMYVALTRAKERLFISMALQRKRLGVETPSRPSRFVLDIPKECLEPVDWKAVQLS